MLWVKIDFLRICFQTCLIDDTFCVSLLNLNLTPRPDNPLTRLIIDQSIYQSAQASGLLSAPGSPLEDQQFALTVTGFSCGTCNWRRSVATRWPGNLKSSTSLEEQNPALVWNLQNRDDVQFSDCQRQILEQCDLVATFAPAIRYKNLPVTATSLEIGLTSVKDYKIWIVNQINAKIF